VPSGRAGRGQRRRQRPWVGRGERRGEGPAQ